MNFNESIELNAYSDNANKQFNEMNNRLSQIQSNFQMRMNGKTTSSLVGSFIGTLCWLATFIVCAVMLKNVVNGILLTISLIVVLGLMLFMLINTIVNFSYFGKISDYGSSVTQLQNRVSIGRNSIRSNHDAFLASKAKGWNYQLNAGTSIPEEATSIETTMNNMESFKIGFINDTMNFFYYSAVVMITIVGCVALFPTGGEIMTSISGESLSVDTITTLNAIALIIVGIGEVLLAKLVWSKTDCVVTNTTLFIMILGPVAFLTLITVATLLVMLVIGILSIVLAILGIIAVGAIAIGCLCGG